MCSPVQLEQVKGMKENHLNISLYNMLQKYKKPDGKIIKITKAIG